MFKICCRSSFPRKKKVPPPLPDEYLDQLILFKVILPRPFLSAGSGELIYRKDSKKAFSSESRAGLFIVINVHCFHINLHSFRHALFDRDSSSVQDHLLRQHTGQASLTATISFLRAKTHDTSIKNNVQSVIQSQDTGSD